MQGILAIVHVFNTWLYNYLNVDHSQVYTVHTSKWPNPLNLFIYLSASLAFFNLWGKTGGA